MLRSGEVSYGQYLAAVNAQRINNPSWRIGQTFFNVLYDINPELADSIRGNYNDPYYNDKKIALFLLEVYARWPK